MNVTPLRRILPGQVVMVTRRTHSREYTLRPDPAVRDLCGYLLAVGSARFGVEVVAAAVMSTHVHLVLTDTEGCLPSFLQWFDSLVARALNAYRGRRDAMWSCDGATVTYLADPDAVLDVAAYALSNPVKDGAVARGGDWPGLRTRPNGAALPPKTYARPNFFFREDGELPDEAQLTIHVPPTHRSHGPRVFAGILARAVGEAEARAREAHRASGRRPGTPRSCLRKPWYHRATSPERRGPGTGPREVVTRDKKHRKTADAALRGFRAAYAEARAMWCAGDRGITWPAGTWKMVREHCVSAHPPPAHPFAV